MTYIACIINKNGIVIGSDTRANYFEDYVKNGQIKGKLIKFYWDGNRKIFLLKKKFSIAAQGLLFWGNERLLLSENIKNFEKSLNKQETVQSVAQKIHSYFRNTKRNIENISETMHFIVCGVEKEMPRGFYVNIYYDNENGVEQLPFDSDKTLYVNGDGKGEWVNEILDVNGAIVFCRNEILRKHKKVPFDVGDKLDILVMPISGIPYWQAITENAVMYKTYDELMNAIGSGNLKVEKLNEPTILYYKNL